MNNNSVILILVFGLTCLTFIFIAVIFIVLAIIFIRSTSSTTKKFSYRPDKQDEEFLASASLRSVESQCMVSISPVAGRAGGAIVLGSAEVMDIPRVLSRLSRTLRVPGGSPLPSNGIKPEMVLAILKTSQQRIDLKVTSKGVSDTNIQVVTTIDGLEDGSIVVTYPTCTYRSKDGAVEAHWIAELRWNNETHVLNRLTSRNVRYDTLTVNGRNIAAITDTWIRYPHPESTKPFHPTLQSVIEDLTSIEQNVLLIAVGLGLYYDSLRNRQSYVYDW